MRRVGATPNLARLGEMTHPERGASYTFITVNLRIIVLLYSTSFISHYYLKIFINSAIQLWAASVLD